jgi:hypothetical protein
VGLDAAQNGIALRQVRVRDGLAGNERSALRQTSIGDPDSVAGDPMLPAMSGNDKKFIVALLEPAFLLNGTPRLSAQTHAASLRIACRSVHFRKAIMVATYDCIHYREHIETLEVSAADNRQHGCLLQAPRKATSSDKCADC